jgi:hypothetical protein
LPTNANTAPPKEAFLIHHVATRFHVKNVMKAQRKIVSVLFFKGFLKIECSTINRGTNATNNMGVNPVGIHERPKRRPLNIERDKS